MARFRGSNWKKSRRLGISLSGTGKELEKRPYAPGQHGPNQRKNYQNMVYNYVKNKNYVTYMEWLKDNSVTHLTSLVKIRCTRWKLHDFISKSFRRCCLFIRFSSYCRQARQLVNHGHILVDGKRVDIPSYSVKPGQTISVREKSQKLNIIVESVEINNFVPEYLNFDADSLTGTFVRLPERSELPAEINEQLIVEYYSR